MSEAPKEKVIINFDTPFEGPSMEWTTQPMKRRPLAAILTGLFILVVSMIVFYITYSKFFTGLALLVLFASVAKFYLPTKFRMTDEFVLVKSSTQTIARRWADIRSYYPDKNGVLLSPFSHPSRLENFRGLYLIFDNNKEKVVSFIKERVKMVEDEDNIIEDGNDK